MCMEAAHAAAAVHARVHTTAVAVIAVERLNLPDLQTFQQMPESEGLACDAVTVTAGGRVR